MTITVNAAQVRQLESKLERLNSRGLLFAELEAVNRAAFETQKDARRNLAGKMTLRNTWTQRSILVQKANRMRLEATVGSTQGYMETQELGGKEEGKGGGNVAIPTSVASGEGRGATPRKKLVRKPNKMSSIVLNRRKVNRSNSTGNRKRRNLYAVKQAAASGNKYVFLELQRAKGIFRLYGGKRKPRLEMVQDLSRKVVNIPRNPWLMPAANKQARQLPRYYGEALARQLKRLR